MRRSPLIPKQKGIFFGLIISFITHKLPFHICYEIQNISILDKLSNEGQLFLNNSTVVLSKIILLPIYL